MNQAAETLPTLTKDLNHAKADLDMFGYCLIADALSPAEVETARTRLLEQATAENQRGLSFRDGGPNQRVVDDYGKVMENAFTEASGGVNQRLWMLANKGPCFRDMIVHPLADELVGHILGNEFILSTMSANIAKAGGVRMGLHTDQWWMPQPIKPGSDYQRASEISRNPVGEFVDPESTLGISPPVVSNIMWMLSDFSVENGATEFVPRSHLSGAHPHPENQSHYPIVQPTAPAGSAMVFDGRLWHGTGANTGGEDRLGVLTTFCSPQFRQQENQTIGIDPELWETFSDKLKARLGFKIWNAYGRVESPAAGMVSPIPDRIGELKPN
ncbi:MAG: phytanoyl-CoA dioxygenase family protein [Pseudomonadota bacterium]